MDKLRQNHNIAKRRIISTQKGNVLDVGSGQGGDVTKYMRNNNIKTTLLEPTSNDFGGLGNMLMDRLKGISTEQRSKFTVVSSKIEDFETDSLFDNINMFFSLTHINIEILVEKLNKILCSNGSIYGIAMFEEDVMYTNTPGFSIRSEGLRRVVNVHNSHVINVYENKISFKAFVALMSKYFVCVRVAKVGEHVTMSNYEIMFNDMNTIFMFKRKNTELGISCYIDAFTSPPRGFVVERELRCVLGRDGLRNLVFDECFNNDYDIFSVFNHNCSVRKYDDGSMLIKSLLFKKKEIVNHVEYNICVSFEKDTKSMPPNVSHEARRRMKRHIKKLTHGCTLFLSEIEDSEDEKKIEMEIEFDNDLSMAERYMISLLSEKRNPFLLPRLPPPNLVTGGESTIKGFVATPKLDGERLYLFGNRRLGIWSWNRNQRLELVSEHCNIDIILDSELMSDGKYVVLDVVDKKLNLSERMSRVNQIVYMWNRLYDVGLVSKTDKETIALYPEDGTIYTSKGIYNSPIYKVKRINTIDIAVLSDGSIADQDVIPHVEKLLKQKLEPGIYEVTFSGEVIKKRHDKAHANYRDVIVNTMTWVNAMKDRGYKLA
ncbi:hypothetical protein DL89DRAFT_287349 [Linderina pennispora]|uniref:Uncharacterized protein n=1 Tax=Linderina pennispora TaxID=61395 RepID=A0A1Y1VV70_9FUNG|nr:uncharacterized protein DL89DRAFT_287349 [Linderina pennispora]ORX65189.1 hypothetical protein DL89DRAFT_287349 [Linderina pennispora]